MLSQTRQDRFWTWVFRLWEAYEVLGLLVVGVGALGIALVTWRTPVVGPFHGPASERAAQDAHDGLTLIFALLGGPSLLIGLVWGFFLVRQVREETDGKWG